MLFLITPNYMNKAEIPKLSKDMKRNIDEAPTIAKTLPENCHVTLLHVIPHCYFFFNMHKLKKSVPPVVPCILFFCSFTRGE